MKAAVIYLRALNKEEAEHDAIEVKLGWLRKYADEEDYFIDEEFIDVSCAKSSLSLVALIDYVQESKDAKAIIVDSLDSLYRAFADHVKLDIEQTGVTFLVAREKLILNNRAETLKAFMARARLTATRVHLADQKKKGPKRARKKQLETAGTGGLSFLLPFGGVGDMGLAPHPQAARLLQRLFTLHASGRHSLKMEGRHAVANYHPGKGGRGMGPGEVAHVLSRPSGCIWSRSEDRIGEDMWRALLSAARRARTDQQSRKKRRKKRNP